MSGQELSGRAALVSGGATGIGAAIVARLAEAGASVLYTDISEPQAEPTDGVRFLRADATTEAGAEASVAAALAAFGRLDIAVNNVGNFGVGDSHEIPLHETDLAVWDGTVRQCLTSCMLGMKHALRPMVAAGSGAIVNISALAGIRVTPYASPAYTAAKAAIAHLTRQAGVLYARSGVRVNCVAPGLTETANMRKYIDAAWREAVTRDFHPMGRMARPEEIADACVWAASDRSSAITGHIIPVDGGWAAR
jgi:NAD(P)-dependent dehydrogenase (short-subunit alcohol dehydrogenase family)